ncbi:uncharacterized protein LOC119632724 isoform X1 [Glossina fuscipes]|uniref:Uncharacterized protein LOC119632724 isoform X1 n=1 Tax=Glossina fuscipes TaxID=7396 RepID=A0A8U0W964_9MUSC|nr:uncharacterized protein LOC119632724 isoform X1 [Glossina fuscipes]
MRRKIIGWFAFFWIIYAIQADNCHERLRIGCRNVVGRRVCYFDEQRICFKSFNNECEMQLFACHYRKTLARYDNKFCELLQFMCNEDLNRYKWPPDYFEQQIATIYKKRDRNPYNNGLYINNFQAN